MFWWLALLSILKCFFQAEKIPLDHELAQCYTQHLSMLEVQALTKCFGEFTINFFRIRKETNPGKQWKMLVEAYTNELLCSIKEIKAGIIRNCGEVNETIWSQHLNTNQSDRTKSCSTERLLVWCNSITSSESEVIIKAFSCLVNQNDINDTKNCASQSFNRDYTIGMNTLDWLSHIDAFREFFDKTICAAPAVCTFQKTLASRCGGPDLAQRYQNSIVKLIGCSTKPSEQTTTAISGESLGSTTSITVSKSPEVATTTQSGGRAATAETPDQEISTRPSQELTERVDLQSITTTENAVDTTTRDNVLASTTQTMRVTSTGTNQETSKRDTVTKKIVNPPEEIVTEREPGTKAGRQPVIEDVEENSADNIKYGQRFDLTTVIEPVVNTPREDDRKSTTIWSVMNKANGQNDTNGNNMMTDQTDDDNDDTFADETANGSVLWIITLVVGGILTILLILLVLRLHFWKTARSRPAPRPPPSRRQLDADITVVVPPRQQGPLYYESPSSSSDTEDPLEGQEGAEYFNIASIPSEAYRYEEISDGTMFY